jgi:hypothetical protein
MQLVVPEGLKIPWLLRWFLHRMAANLFHSPTASVVAASTTVLPILSVGRAQRTTLATSLSTLFMVARLRERSEKRDHKLHNIIAGEYVERNGFAHCHSVLFDQGQVQVWPEDERFWPYWWAVLVIRTL